MTYDQYSRSFGNLERKLLVSFDYHNRIARISICFNANGGFIRIDWAFESKSVILLDVMSTRWKVNYVKNNKIKQKSISFFGFILNDGIN